MGISEYHKPQWFLSCVYTLTILKDNEAKLQGKKYIIAWGEKTPSYDLLKYRCRYIYCCFYSSVLGKEEFIEVTKTKNKKKVQVVRLI